MVTVMSQRLTQILSVRQPSKAIVMGVLNITPDSFSDGGNFLSPAAAIARARQMIADGADIIDVGAESTRPSSARVSPREQIARLEPVLGSIVKLGSPVSVDTTRAEVAKFALAAGAEAVNDVSAGRDEPEIFRAVADSGAWIVLMHMLGEPATMQQNPHYADVVSEVLAFLAGRAEEAVAAGVDRERIIIDPGIGFGKTLGHNLALLRSIDKFVELGYPVLVGPSRKRFIGELTGQAEAVLRVGGTISACLEARRRGAAVFRVHDVSQVAAAFKVQQAVEGAD